MTATPSKLPPQRTGSVCTLSYRVGCALAFVGLSLCLGCGPNPASEYHEYSSNGRSEDDLSTSNKTASQTGASGKVADDNKVAAKDSQPGPTTAGDSATPATTPPQTETTGKPLTGQAAPNNPPNASPAKPAGDLPNEIPVVAIKPTPKNAGGDGRSVTATASVPRQPKVLVPERQFQVVGPQGAIRVSYDDIDLMRVLNMEPVTPDALSLMPEWLKGLDGKRVRLRGFMFPSFEPTGLTGFGFARDNDVCCFVRQPKVYDVFQVRLREGETTDYIPGRPFDVVGVFHFVRNTEDWQIFGMYHIDDAIVIDK